VTRLRAIDTELAGVQARVDALGLKAIPFQVEVVDFARMFATMSA
jgi:hypothetical protein